MIIAKDINETKGNVANFLLETNNILHLTLRQEWFNMIAMEIKKKSIEK